MMFMARSALAVAKKDIRSELRMRFGVTSIALFVVTAVSIIAFALGAEVLRKPIVVALVWVVMFYTSLTGLGRAFISEEERGTALFLRLNTLPLAVYWGKLLINVALSLTANLLATIVFIVFIPSFEVHSWPIYFSTLIVGSIGLSAVLSITSAIVAKAGVKNPILPVLSFPLLVPIVMVGVRTMLYSMGDFTLWDVRFDLLVLGSYSGLVILASTLVFEFIWAE